MIKKGGLTIMFFLLFVMFIEDITYSQREDNDMKERQIIDYGLNDLENVNMSYRIQGAYSPYKYIAIDIPGRGEGELDYELYSEYMNKNQEKERPIRFKVNEEKIKELVELYREADFFNLEVLDLNKDKISVTDVGTTTVTYSYKGRERKLSYGYVENNPLAKLIKVYWEIVQEHLPK